MPSLAPFLVNYNKATLDGEMALYLYEQHWQEINTKDIAEAEQALLDQLIAFFGNGLFAPLD